MTPHRFTSRTRNDCLEITGEAESVTPGFIRQLFSEIQTVNDAGPRLSPKALIEVIAPSAEISFLERFQVWERSFPLIRKRRVAYVVTGRPLSADISFFELLAYNRGVTLKFFECREAAIEWLGAPAAKAGNAEPAAPDKP